MAERKPLYMSVEGYSDELALADSITLGGLTMGGDVVMAANKITGLGAASAAGDALGFGQSGASLSGLIVDTSDLSLANGAVITGLPASPTGATDATSKAYVDSAITGLIWKDPVSVLRLVGNGSATAINALSVNAGAAYVVSAAGTLTRGSVAVVAGDVVEDDGTDWVKLESGSGGFVAAGVRAILSGTDTLIAPYTDAVDNDQIVNFSGTSLTGTDTGDTVNKAATAVHDSGHLGYYDNDAYTYEGSAPPGSWVLFNSGATVVAGLGLTKSGNTLNVGTGDGVVVAADTVGIDLAATPGLVLTGTSPAKKLELLLKSAAELAKDASGLYIVGVPALFQVGGVAVGANVTAPNLDTLVTGSSSDAQALHTHGNLSASAHTHTHASTTGQTANDHHNQAHALDGGDHTASGLTTGHVMTATGATTFAFQAQPTPEAGRIENTLTTATDTTANGDPVYNNGNNTIGQGDSAVPVKARIVGVIRTGAGAPGSTPEVVSAGPCPGILSGATANAVYYLQNGGGLGTTPPASGDRNIVVGTAMNATDLFVKILDYGRRA